MKERGILRLRSLEDFALQASAIAYAILPFLVSFPASGWRSCTGVDQREPTAWDMEMKLEGVGRSCRRASDCSTSGVFRAARPTRLHDMSARLG